MSRYNDRKLSEVRGHPEESDYEQPGGHGPSMEKDAGRPRAYSSPRVDWSVVEDGEHVPRRLRKDSTIEGSWLANQKTREQREAQRKEAEQASRARQNPGSSVDEKFEAKPRSDGEISPSVLAGASRDAAARNSRSFSSGSSSLGSFESKSPRRR